MSSTPTTSDANMLHQSIKSPTFLKDVNKNMKEMYFNNWAYTERSGYKVTSTFNIQTLKVTFHSSNLNYFPSVNITDRLNIINFKQPPIGNFLIDPKLNSRVS